MLGILDFLFIIIVFFFFGGGGVLLREDASGLEFSPFQLVPVLALSKLRQVNLVNLMSVSVQLHILGTQPNKPYIVFQQWQ